MSKHSGPVLCPLCIYTLARAMMDQVLGFASLRDFSSTGSLTLTAVSVLDSVPSRITLHITHLSLLFQVWLWRSWSRCLSCTKCCNKIGKIKNYVLFLCFLHVMDLLDNYFIVKYLMRLCAYLGCARVQKFGSWLYFPLIQQEMTHEIDQ